MNASFVHGRSISEPVGANNHIMTKQEVIELVQSQFPDGTVSEPMAIGNLRLVYDPYSHYRYFLVLYGQ
jgi:hypothetical protein